MAGSKTARIRITMVALTAASLLAGCGASTSTVKSKVSTPTSQEAATTKAPTTESSTTEASTTEAPSTDAPDTTTGDSGSLGGGGSLPASAKAAFMESCSKGAGAATCECVWGKIENDLSVDALMAAGSSGSVPADLQKKIIDATMSCMTSTSS